MKNNDQTYDLWNKTNNILEEYNLPNKFSKLNTDILPPLNSLIDNLYNDKKCLSIGNRFIICEKVGDASLKYIYNEEMISQAFNILF